MTASYAKPDADEATLGLAMAGGTAEPVAATATAAATAVATPAPTAAAPNTPATDGD